jgi:hypothetical protein
MALDRAFDEADGELQAIIRRRGEATRAKLLAAFDRAEAAVDRLEKEAEAKTETLAAQIENASGEAEATIEGTIASVGAEHEIRSARLRQAMALARAALGPDLAP